MYNNISRNLKFKTMRKGIFLSMLALATTISLTSCGGAEEVKYTLNAKETSLNWTGKYVQDGHTHTGTVNVTEGTLVYKGEEFVSGNFKIDLASLSATDVQGESKSHLDEHLKSADYFNTGSNPNAKVEITAITAKEIQATIKLLGKEVKAVMPLKISKDEKSFTANGKFEVDFAVLGAKGFKAAPGDSATAHPDTKIAFEMNLVLKK